MTRPKRSIGALAAFGLLLAGLAYTASSASATHNSVPPCMVVTQDTTLTGDVGPCPGHGIVIAADNVTLDLAGFSVIGEQTPMEQAGILLDGVTGVTVMNGTVTGFDAGVSIEGGGGNTVTGITATGNVNDMMEPIDPFTIITPGQTTPPTPQQRHDINLVTCIYGDGITTSDSDNNVITNNIVTENGPFSGISLVGDSDGNVVSKNEVHENDLLNRGVVDENGNPVWTLGNRHVPAGTPGATQPTSMCGATEIGTPGMSRGREVQSIGIRIEGPGADENLVEKNTVTKSALAGISFHSYVAFPAAPNVPAQAPNTNNVVSKNSVSLTGADTHTLDPYADGISSLSSGPIGNVTMPSHSNTIEKNVVFENMRHGISLMRLTFDNSVDKNQVNNNGGSGVYVADGAFDNVLTKNTGRGNAEFDGFDGNPNCDNNRWSGNQFTTVNQPCVAVGNAGRGNGNGGGRPDNPGQDRGNDAGAMAQSPNRRA